MNLTDREILELNELCGAVVDGTLTEAQRDRLARWLRDSEAARRFYVRALGQSASLHTYAAETHAEAPDARMVRPKTWQAAWWWATVLPAAAALVFGLWYAGRSSAPETRSAGESVACLTGVKDARWASGPLAPGARLGKEQPLELAAGFAEITFDSGARVVLEGPASLALDSAWNATLRRGTLKASVPPEAIGFRVSSPAVEVVDLGTEFTMIADGKGTAEVLVLKGEVEAAPHAAGEADTIRLRAKEARRFEPGRVSDVSDSAEKFARFTQPLALDHFSTVVNYVHWSFDEADGTEAKADTHGIAGGNFDAQITLEDGRAPFVAHARGRHGSALRFDGRVYARASFPGLSGSMAHTIAFWVKVPGDAQLSDAFSMVTWGLNSRRLGTRHVGINWNKNPADGPLGALRTDFRGGHAVGTTTLRDGRWHHITVVFASGGDTAPVHVQQYVDGRLESSAVTLDPMHAAASPDDHAAMAALTDVLWLGCRLSVRGLTASGRFRGEIDELFVADRALAPQEIVAVMNDNRLPVSGLALAR